MFVLHHLFHLYKQAFCGIRDVLCVRLQKRPLLALDILQKLLRLHLFSFVQKCAQCVYWYASVDIVPLLLSSFFVFSFENTVWVWCLKKKKKMEKKKVVTSQWSDLLLACQIKDPLPVSPPLCRCITSLLGELQGKRLLVLELKENTNKSHNVQETRNLGPVFHFCLPCTSD